MPALRPEMLRGILGALCVCVFAAYAFTFSNAQPSRAVPRIEVEKPMPTARDLSVFSRQLRRASRESRFAGACARGQILGGSEIHFAMNFPPVGETATRDNPRYARAHADGSDNARKVLVLESKDPTLWTVTGEPAAIFLMGAAVVADFPEGTPVFAPRYAAACQNARWLKLPRNWTFPMDQNVMNSLVDNLAGRFESRAQYVSENLFNRPAASWIVQRGDVLMSF